MDPSGARSPSIPSSNTALRLTTRIKVTQTASLFHRTVPAPWQMFQSVQRSIIGVTSAPGVLPCKIVPVSKKIKSKNQFPPCKGFYRYAFQLNR